MSLQPFLLPKLQRQQSVFRPYCRSHIKPPSILAVKTVVINIGPERHGLFSNRGPRCMKRPGRPRHGATYHAWRVDQDTKIQSPDGSCAFYLERPLTAGRLDAEWNYKIQLGNKQNGPAGITIMTIRRESTKVEGISCEIIALYGADEQMITCMRWYGDTKKRMSGKASGTKKYTFDWQGRELMWDSHNSFSGTDHICIDIGSGEVLCYFRTVFWPLTKDGKIEINPKVKDETTRTMLMASCMAYREWADKRQTGVYVK